MQEAEAALVSLVTNENAPATLCMEAVADLLARDASLEELQSAVQMLHDRLHSTGDSLAASKATIAFSTMVAMDAKRVQVSAPFVSDCQVQGRGIRTRR